MKVNLFINYYTDPHIVRRQELDGCLVRNISNPLIDKIIVVYDWEQSSLKEFNKRKLVRLPWLERPTFNEMFRLTRYFPDSINIIANSDIFFDQTLQLVKDYNWSENVCMALARWDVQPDGSLRHFNMDDTNDTWIFKGAAPNIPEASFTLGILGCDNKIAHLLRENGYRVINPSLTIKTLHLHNSGIRNYTTATRLLPPYHLIRPTTL